MVFALPVFLWAGIVAGRAGGPALTGGDWARLTGLGLLGYYGASILDFWGLQYISAGLERLILFTYPTLTVLLGVVLHGRSVSRREGIALALCYAGVGFAFAHDLRFGDATVVWVGGGLVFASSLSYALYLSGSGGMIARLGAMRFTALAMGVSTAATLLHFLAVQPLSTFVQPWPVYGLGVAMALLATVVPVFAQSAAIRAVGPNRAALVGMLGPPLTIFFGWWWLGETISGAQLAGAALVIVGVVIVSRR